MAAKELYDYLSQVTPDKAVTLTTPYPQRILVEEGTSNQIIHMGDDDSEERISFSDDPVLYVTPLWEALSESDGGTIMDYYFDTTKGNKRKYSFYWAGHPDGHTYVVRFDCDASRTIRAGNLGTGAGAARNLFGWPSVRFRVLGYA